MDEFIFKTTTKNIRIDLLAVLREKIFIEILKEGNNEVTEAKKEFIYRQLKKEI